ncbi:MAG: hypothetical protein ABEI13_03650, partial [Candidatus Paceibacteria bacterium]
MMDPKSLLRWLYLTLVTRIIRVYIIFKYDKKEQTKIRPKHDLNILFLCLGNISRSPFAERQLIQKLDTNYRKITIQSAGFLDKEGRKSPAFAREIAKMWDIDLTDHRSRRVSKDMVKNSDLIFIMDSRNYYEFMRRFPQYIDKVEFLGKYNNGVEIEIPDPHGKSKKQFCLVYSDISDS